jgi:predicted site-specific integrase-resolvase
LDRQVRVATAHCEANGFGTPLVFTDVGSGLCTNRAGLARLSIAIERGLVGIVVVTFEDRLTRFGFDYLRRYFASHGASIIVAKQAPSRTMHEELVDDLIAIVTSFSGRVHGLRGHHATTTRQRQRLAGDDRDTTGILQVTKRAIDRALAAAVAAAQRQQSSEIRCCPGR